MSYHKLLSGSNFNVGAWKPKHANRVGARVFPMSKWRSKYWAAKANGRAKVVSNFKANYDAWLADVERLRLVKKMANNAARSNILAMIHASRKPRSASVARRTPTPRAPHLSASARHSGARRTPSLRQILLTPSPSTVARARANAKLTNLLKSPVANLVASLRRRHA